MKLGIGIGIPMTSSGMSLVQQLQNVGIGGLTFFKDYRPNVASLDADYSVGSATATYEAARSASAPSTWVRNNGDGTGTVMLLTDADVRRRTEGYFDETGFHVQSGEMIEAGGTNLILCNTFDPNMLVDNTVFEYSGQMRYTAISSGTGAISSRTVESGNPYIGYGRFIISNQGSDSGHIALHTNGQAVTIVSGTVYTASMFLRVSTPLTNAIIQFRNIGGTTYDTNQTFSITTTNTWVRLSFVFTANANANDALLYLRLGLQGTPTIDFTGFQLEASPYATSFIPTTTSALTRPVELLSYPTTNNRTVAAESIFIKLAIEYGYASTVSNRYPGFIATAQLSGDRIMGGGVSAYDSFANQDTVACRATGAGTDWGANTSNVFALIVQHANPYINYYKNSSSMLTETADDFAANSFSATWRVGARYSAAGQPDACIQSVAIYSRALSAAEVAVVTNILNSGSL